jgi:spore coat polysaccharide biosynthesis protein SpsF (cytidylyltransferase family)
VVSFRSARGIESTILSKTDGFYRAVEVFSFKTIEKTWKEANTNYDREHVTPYIYGNPSKFSTFCVQSPTNYSTLSWTVDRKEDFEFVKSLYNKIKKKTYFDEGYD